MVARASMIAGMVLVAACGSQAPTTTAMKPTAGAKLPDGPPLLTPREQMSYRLQLGGVDLATYDLAAGDVTEVDGKKVIVVQAHAKTRGLAAMVANVDDTFTSWIDVSTGRPVRFSVEEATAEDAKIQERTEVRMDQRAEDAVPVQVWENDKQVDSTPQKVSMADVWDYNAYLIALRAWEAPKGSTVTCEAFRSRYLWNVTMTIHGEEKLVTEVGEFQTLRFDAHAFRLTRDGKKSTDAAERDFSIWITNDSGRVPVLTKAVTDYGSVELAITDYQPGSGDRLRP